MLCFFFFVLFFLQDTVNAINYLPQLWPKRENTFYETTDSDQTGFVPEKQDTIRQTLYVVDYMIKENY